VSKKDIIAACLALFILSGCVHGKLPEVKTPVTAPVPRDILQKIARPVRGETIRATARISQSSPDGDYSRKVALVLRMPSSIRAEAIPFFGPADFFLSANEESLKVFLPGEATFYADTPTRENIFLIFRVFLSPADMVPLLAGFPPPCTEEGSLSGFVEGESYRIDITSGKSRRSLWIDLEANTLIGAEECEDGRTLWKAAFTNHAVVNGRSFPQRICLDVYGAGGRARMDIRYLDMDTASAGDGELFDLPVPPGITPVPIGR